MKKLIFKCAAAALLLCLIIAALGAFTFFVAAPQFGGEYNASLLDKTARMESISGPKILLVGNSNVAFGFDSALLEEKMGMPVVNLGLHGGLGNPFCENVARDHIGPGDIVVVCHNDYGDEGAIGDYDLAWITVENHFRFWNLVPEGDWLGMFSAFPGYLERCAVKWATGTGNDYPGGCYDRSAFNEYGDSSYPRSECTVDWANTPVELPAISDTCMARLNAWHMECRELGATLLVAGYPVADGPYTPGREEYRALWQQLQDNLECAVISDIEDYFYPYDYFYNTHLHLTEAGARARTEQLAQDLQIWQGD